MTRFAPRQARLRSATDDIWQVISQMFKLFALLAWIATAVVSTLTISKFLEVRVLAGNRVQPGSDISDLIVPFAALAWSLQYISNLTRVRRRQR
jgi:hypothetical protein